MNKHAPKHIWAWNQEFFKHAEAQPKKGCAYKKKGCTVGCVWNFQIGGGSIKAIFQSRKLKFDMVLYFGLINCPTVAKKFSCKNGF